MTMTHTLSPKALTGILDALLSADEFKDHCPNGLQVDADTPIHTVVTGVTACQALIDEAIKLKAQAILVHHGYFWKGEPEPLTDMKGKRIRALLQNNLSLLAYHLPLDAHPMLGNNALLAKALDLTITGALYPEQKHPVGNIAICEAITPSVFAKKIGKILNRTPLHIDTGDDTPLTKIGLCTGAAQDMIEQAYQMGCQAFISGEISERTTHTARELGVHYYAVGHHASETFGVKALGEYLANEHNLTVEFVEVDNPV